MAQFRYRALNADGSELQGDIAAETEREAARLLERRGLTPILLQDATAPVGGARTPGFALGTRERRLRQQDVILALHELSTLLASGVALGEAVAAQAGSAHHPRLLGAFEGISAGLRGGQSFSQALAATSLPLPPYVDTLVRSGEKARTTQWSPNTPTSGSSSRTSHNAVSPGPSLSRSRK